MNETKKQLPPLNTSLLMLFEETPNEGYYIIDEIIKIEGGYMSLKSLDDWHHLPSYWENWTTIRIKSSTGRNVVYHHELTPSQGRYSV